MFRGNSSLSTSSSESFSERTFSEKISSSTRDENGWTALHAAAFYGKLQNNTLYIHAI